MIAWKAYSLVIGVAALVALPFGWVSVAVAGIIININCFKLNVKKA